CDTTQKGCPLPFFPMQWPPPAGFDSSVYDGLGTPQPGQPDSGKKSMAWIGVYHSPVTSAVRWWMITGPKGSGLRITSDSSLFNGSLVGTSPIPTSPTPTPPIPTPSVLLNIFYRLPPADDSSGNTPGQSFHLPYANY